MFYQPILIGQLGVYNWLKDYADTKADAMWDKYFIGNTVSGGSVFGYVCDAVLPIALLAFFLNFMQQVRIYQENKEGVRLVTGFIIPAIIVFSLAGQGPILKLSVLAMRNVTNNITSSVLRNFEAASATDTLFSQTIANSEKLDFYKAEAKKCASLVTTGDERIKCFADLRDRIQGDPDVLTSPAFGAVRDLATGINNAISTTTTDPLKALDGLLGAIGKINPLNIIATGFTNFLMSAIAAGISNAMEVSFMVTGFIFPLFVAIAPLENGWKALVSWMTGFWSIFVFRLSYVIIIALAGTLYDQSSGAYEFQLGIFTALIAPVLAAILAAGGGMGFFNAAVSVGTKIVTKAIGI
jgi:hypothetical protein